MKHEYCRIAWWLAGILLVAGLALLKTGVWPRQRDETPHCPACNYNLTGLTSERCPECGTAVTPSAIGVQRRPRRPARIATGVVLLCLSGGLVAAARSHIDWYPVAPAALLISQIRSGDVPTAEVASTIRIGPSLVFERLWHELGLPEILKEILSNRRARRCRQLPKHDSLHKTLLAARQE